jgi:alpha-galactosidase
MPSKIAIIGGGSSTFTPQLLQLLSKSDALRGSTVTLMDIDAHRLDVMQSLASLLGRRTGAHLAVESTTNQREALAGADFVITAISVGGFDAWGKDIEIPATYGIYMPIADSIGPGGIMRAFRHIPVLVGVVKELEEVSPEAWVFNYTNPMTAICLAMRQVSAVKTVGLCTCAHLPRNARALAELAGVSSEEVVAPAPAAGLNHCAAIIELHLRNGQDALPLIRERTIRPILKWGLENFQILPYPVGHWPEFFPPFCQPEEPYSGKIQGARMRFGGSAHDMTAERARQEHWETLTEKLAHGEEDFSLDVLPQNEAVEVVEIMEALICNAGNVHVVNVPNCGAVSNLPGDAVIEVSSLVDGYGIHPLHLGKLPDSLAATLGLQSTVQQLTVEAALSGDRRTAIQAFVQDPCVAAVLMPGEAEKLLDEMLTAHAGYLPQFA